ncbi:hypothetical protein DFQ27_007691 [Actinomortierella ambigua]|uniref:YitH/HolE acetyltransferase (GNAT) domain-containing protein n=1 Tax=Actinomortierella ambigua TaxID=1343610 RepID=A0A9P6TZE1_9FUNG|nr:hypothetical protein DFQ27_007691 [Actinomortierella ambigua]
MVPRPDFVVSQATAKEAQTLYYEWPRELHWNPGRNGNDMEQVFYPLYPEAFRVGRLSVTAAANDNNGSSTSSKPVSTLLAIQYSDSLGFIAINVVDEAYRGQGLGLLAFKDAMKRFHPQAIVALDSAVEQVENYKKSGFVHVAWDNVRSDIAIDHLLENATSSKLQQHQVIEIGQVSLEELVRVEKQYAGFDRPKFVARWQAYHTDSADQHRFGVAVLAQDNKTVLGYGAIRPGVEAYKVGPLYASDDAVATAILKALGERVLEASKSRPLTTAAGVVDPVVLRMEVDIPDANKQGTQLLWDVLGFKEMIRTVRMWAGPAPPAVQVSGLYGVCSLEGG